MIAQARPKTPPARPRPRAELGPSSSLQKPQAIARVITEPVRAADNARSDPSSPAPSPSRTEDEASAARYAPPDLLALAEVARYYLFHGEPDTARVLFEGLTSVAPKDARFALGLAVTFDQLDLRSEAIAAYQHAATLDPSDGHPDVNRAELLLADGDRSQARTFLSRGALKARQSKNIDLERKARAMLARLDEKGGRST